MQTRQKDDTIQRLQNSEQDARDQLDRMNEELNIYKGRCQNLLRDIELHAGVNHKLSDDQGQLGEQLQLYKSRVS